MNGGDPVPRAAMMNLEEAARVLAGELAGAPVEFFGVTTDSRAIDAGDLFIAIRGERFDGNDYVAEAIARGAAGALTSRRVAGDLPIPQVIVGDTRLALGRLAAHWRRRFAQLPLVALTGSNGKTTVKEMLAAILARHAGAAEAVLATKGNLNNDIGMPVTLLGLRERHRFAVIEMGMNHAGEIDYLTRIAAPQVAIVNNAQRAHVGLLGSVEAIAHAKGEIYSGLGADGVAVINADDGFAAYWVSLNLSRRIVSFGFAAAATVRGEIVGERVRVTTPRETFEMRLRVAGEHNVRNALAACAGAYALGVDSATIAAALGEFSGVPGRLQRRPAVGGATLIDDTYNANPESMKAAIAVLAAERGRRVFVMGDMGELGEQADAMHAEVGRFAREKGIERLLALGPASRHAAAAFGAGAAHFTDMDELRVAAAHEAAASATILVKGSRFMQMERLADFLAADGSPDAV